MKKLIEVLLLPLCIVANLISLLCLTITSPIWISSASKWARGKVSIREYYNTVFTCGLITRPFIDDETYKCFVRSMYLSRSKKLRKLINKTQKEDKLVMDILKEYNSLM